jgi:hypothetical protein
MIREIINLSILNAFQIDPADVAYKLGQRIKGKRLALLNWGPTAIKISFATRNGETLEVAPEELMMPPNSPLPKVAEALKQRTDCDCVALLYSAVNLFSEAQAGSKVPAGEALERKLRHEAKGLIGSSYEEDKVYQMLTAPDGFSRIIFAVSRAPYQELEKGLKEEGLTIVRSQLAPYTLMNALLGDEGWRAGETPEAIILPMVICQAHVIVADFDGQRVSPEIFRATPLFLEKGIDMIEQLRAFFLNCAESAVMAKRVMGKRVIFKWVDARTSTEEALDLASYLQDRIDVGFERWKETETNIDFKALLEG